MSGDDSDTEEDRNTNLDESSEDEESEEEEEKVKVDLFTDYQRIYRRDGKYVNEVIRRLNGEKEEEDAEREEDELVERAQLEGALTVVEDVDIERGRNWECDMILYNLRNYSTRAIENLVGCKIKDVNFSMGAMGVIMFRIVGTYNAIQAIVNVANSGEGTYSKYNTNHKGITVIADAELFFKQGSDDFEKLRNVFILGAPEIKNVEAWKAAVRSEINNLGIEVKVKEVGVFNKGFTTVTFLRHKEALIFEKRPYPIEIMGHNVTISRTAFPVIRTPADVVVDGFHLEDRAEIINLIQREGGPIRLIEFLPRMSKVSAIVTLARFSDATKLVKLRNTPLIKEHSNVESTITFEWGRDVNTRKERKTEGKSTQNTGEKSDALALTFKEKLVDMDKWRREDKKEAEEAMRKMREENQKERKEDKIAAFQIMADLQERIVSLISMVMSAVADKQASVAKLTGALSDLRQARLIVNVQITKQEGKTQDENRARIVADLKAQRAIIEEEIKTADDRLEGVINAKILLPVLPSPSVRLIEASAPVKINKQARNMKDNNKRRSEARLIPPNKMALEEYSIALKNKEGQIEQIAGTCWNTLRSELEGFLIMEGEEVISFCAEATDELLRTEIIAKLNSFVTVFRATRSATKVIDFINKVEGEFVIHNTTNKRNKK